MTRMSGLVHMFVGTGIDKPLVFVNPVLPRGGRISGHAVGLGILVDSLPGRPSGLAIPAPHSLVLMPWGRDVIVFRMSLNSLGSFSVKCSRISVAMWLKFTRTGNCSDRPRVDHTKDSYSYHSMSKP